MFRRILVFGLTAVVAWAACHPVDGARRNRVVEIGEQAPVWSNLSATDGKQYGLDSFGDAKAIVIVFTCNSCPVASAYQERLMKLAADYKDQGVMLVAINVNKGETVEKMRQLADDRGFNFLYLRDDSQQSARQYGAVSTPDVFLLNQDRKIAYMGAIDDNWDDAAAVQTHYLRDAVEAVLAGERPAKSETTAVGCSIRWKN